MCNINYNMTKSNSSCIIMKRIELEIMKSIYFKMASIILLYKLSLYSMKTYCLWLSHVYKPLCVAIKLFIHNFHFGHFCIKTHP